METSISWARPTPRSMLIAYFISYINQMEALFLDASTAKARFLVAEHLVSDLSSYHKPYQGGEQLSLANLQRVRGDPYGSGVVSNLVIGDQVDTTAHDLAQVCGTHGVGFVLDVTSRPHGLNVEKLKALEESLQGKVRLLYGYTPKDNYLKSPL